MGNLTVDNGLACILESGLLSVAWEISLMVSLLVIREIGSDSVNQPLSSSKFIQVNQTLHFVDSSKAYSRTKYTGKLRHSTGASIVSNQRFSQMIK